MISVADALSRLPRFKALVVDRQEVDTLSIDTDTNCTLIELLGIECGNYNVTTDIPNNMEMFSIESDDHDHEFKEGMAWGITMIKPDQDTCIILYTGRI